MNENDDTSMTPQEIRDASIYQIIQGLGVGGFIVTSEDIIAAVIDESLRESLRRMIEQAHIASDDVERFGPGKALTNLTLMYKQKLFIFED